MTVTVALSSFRDGSFAMRFGWSSPRPPSHDALGCLESAAILITPDCTLGGNLPSWFLPPYLRVSGVAYASMII